MLSPFFDCVIYFFDIELQELLAYFEINPLSVAFFAIIFSHSEGSLFTLLIVFFVVQKLLSFIRFHLFILLLFPCFFTLAAIIFHIPRASPLEVLASVNQHPLPRGLGPSYKEPYFELPSSNNLILFSLCH